MNVKKFFWGGEIIDQFVLELVQALLRKVVLVHENFTN